MLNSVRLEGGLAGSADLVSLALAIWPDGLSAPEYERAVTDCLARGWIKALTADDCLADAARWKDKPPQIWNEAPYQEGSIDFTQEGWDVYCQQLQAKNGIGIEPLLSRGVQYLWDTPGQVSLIAMSRDTILENLGKILSGEDDPIRTSLDADYQIVKVTEPYPIGPWWVTRFYQSRQGFRADISYNVAGV